ncbi:MAG: DNA-primase RepB domain-containing protein, partial [Nitrosopumilus sp.]
MDATEFLELVWGRQKGYVHLPYKEGDQWHESNGIYRSGRKQQDDPPNNDSDIESALIGYSERDQYFCPMVFSGSHRRKNDAQNTHWLWADLDSVDPRNLELRPTIAWTSSPGRYQALWRLDRRVQPDRQSQLNRRLTYAIGADKGGWDITQVLRLPGSRNHKPEYGHPRMVRLLWNDGPKHAIGNVSSYLKGVEAHLEVIDEDAISVPLPAESRASIISRIRPKLPRRTIELLDGTPETITLGSEGTSGTLWELECRLFES